MRLIAYIRVSRVGGRGGDSFISPDVQREHISHYAQANRHEVVDWFEDLNQSGGKATRPEFDRALELIEQGFAEGIIVAKLDRFMRSLPDALAVIQRIEAAGGQLVSVSEGIDPTTPSGRLMRNQFLSFAQFERERIAEGWATSRSKAVNRGIHIASRTPTGYLRDGDGRLIPDPETAPLVRELFLRRANGAGWTELAHFMTDAGVVTPYGNSQWTPAAVQKVVRNDVYLGRARSGEFRNDDAHEPLLTAGEWHAAQQSKNGVTPRKGEAGLLDGLVRCAGCRYVMKRDSMKDRNGGGRLRTYRCRCRYAAGVCEAPATIMERVVTPYVEGAFLASLEADGVLAQASASHREIETAMRDLEAAEQELEEFLKADVASLLGADRYRSVLAEKQGKVDDARRRLTHAEGTSLLGSGVPHVSGNLGEAWEGLDLEYRRRLIAAAIDAVVVYNVDRRNVPVSERVRIVWRGEAPAGLPQRGKRVPLRAWDDAPAEVGLNVTED